MSASPHIPLRRAPAGEAWLPSERDEPGVQDERRAQAPIKGRGTATQVSHRFQTEARARQDDGWAASTADGSAVADGEPAAPTVRTQLTLQDARSILSRNDSPDVPFELAINSYRGCEHVMWNSSC
jgi:hypothetical protein